MHLHLNLILTVILRKYFQDSRCVLQLYENCTPASINEFPTIIYSLKNASLDDLNYQETQRCEGFIILSNEPETIIENLEDYITKKSQVRYNNRKYIVITQVAILNIAPLNYVSNFLLIKYHDGIKINTRFGEEVDYGVYDLMTHRYIGSESSGELYLVDVWDIKSGRFLYNKSLFPDKISNQYGRILRIGAVDYVPYCIKESQRGTELAFIFEYAKNKNMTPVIVSPYDEIWGEIFDNWTGYGILGKLIMDQQDISLGALFYLPYRILFSDFTQVTAYSRVTCLVPKPRLLQGWLTPITVFTADIWIWYFCTYVVLVFVDYVSKLTMYTGSFRLRHKMAADGAIFNVFTLFIAQGQPEFTVPKENYRRLIHITTLILSLLFAVMYSSRLSSTMIIPRFENDIDTPEELSKSDINWGELFVDWVLPLSIDTQPISRKLAEKFRQGTEDELRQFSMENNFGFGIERLPSGYYAIGEYIKEDIIHTYKVMKEDLYCQYASMQLRKNSVLLPSINMFILRTSQAGLLNHWEAEASMYHSNMKIQMGIVYPHDEPVLIRLKFHHVKGAFGILFLGLLVAAFVLSYEIFRSMYF